MIVTNDSIDIISFQTKERNPCNKQLVDFNENQTTLGLDYLNRGFVYLVDLLWRFDVQREYVIVGDNEYGSCNNRL